MLFYYKANERERQEFFARFCDFVAVDKRFAVGGALRPDGRMGVGASGAAFALS